MGSFTSRQNADVEEAENVSNNAYKYPPKGQGNFFGTHFIMGGERFDTPQPESYLFGENADLNFLGCKPTAFPYPPPQSNEPTKTLKSLVNIRKESVRFVKIAPEKLEEIPSKPAIRKLSAKSADDVDGDAEQEQVDGNVLGLCRGEMTQPYLYNIEFTFDSDVKCAITIYYFCTEEISPSGVTMVPRDGLTSETYHFEKGINQYFSQPGHVFNPQLIPEDDFIYNANKELYPVAIHCVVEEGNEECRQSHTTICVIDSHPESNSYVLRALKQKIFVDGLCYLLQEIYGIENKAVNKSSIDEEIDDHGSEECVICMSETRDTLILPCRHLCLCNSCADSLRYQANNCPICRAPFRALLQIRAVQKGVSTHALHQNTPTGAGETVCDQHVPPGYIPVSLIEALNGPPQYVGRVRQNDSVDGDGIPTIPSNNTAADAQKNTSPHKRRSKSKKTVSTATNTINNENNVSTTTPSDKFKENTDVISGKKSPISEEKLEKSSERPPPDKMQIVNERNSLKLPKNKRNSGSSKINSPTNAINADDDEDSENEKLSPLLSPGSKSQQSIQMAKKLSKNEVGLVIAEPNDVDIEMQCTNASVIEKPQKRASMGSSGETVLDTQVKIEEDSVYYTPEDTNNSILSPLCPDKIAAKPSLSGGDKLSNLKTSSGSFRGGNSLAKKNLHKKSTSVGNMLGPSSTTSNDLKVNVSSLPDMLDSPISGNSASTRSSSDSYSSSSSTKQLLSSNTANAAANIIVDDKTALQNAVNV